MSITTREARQLTTVAEWPVVQSSLPAAIREFPPARLKAKAARARKLWTKYADLVRSQSRAAKGKRPPVPHELNARTKRKAELFAEVFARYEARLSVLAAKVAAKATKSAKSARPRKTGGARKSAPTARAVKAAAARTAADEVAAEVAANAEAAQQGMASMLPPSKVKASRGPVVAKGDLVRRSGQVRMQAHVSSRGRRRQGRRDSR